MKKAVSILGLSSALLLGLTACGSPQAQGGGDAPKVEFSDLSSLEAAAKEEGEVRVYTQLPEEAVAELGKSFEEKYGIKVDALRLGGNTLGSRFDSEVQAGSPTAEVVLTNDLEFQGNQVEQGNMVAFKDTGVKELFDNFPEEADYPEFGVPMIQIVDTGFIYNTDKLSEADLPKDWKDLNGGKLKGKYCSVEPTASANTAAYFWQMREDYGDDTLVNFADNIGRWYPNVVAMNEAVAVGECDLGVNSADFFVQPAAASGAPVAFANAPTNVPPIMTASVTTKAEHPHAARLFMYYALSEEGNRLLNPEGKGSFGTWDTEDIPDFTKPTKESYKKIREDQRSINGDLGF